MTTDRRDAAGHSPDKTTPPEACPPPKITISVTGVSPTTPGDPQRATAGDPPTVVADDSPTTTGGDPAGTPGGDATNPPTSDPIHAGAGGHDKPPTPRPSRPTRPATYAAARTGTPDHTRPAPDRSPRRRLRSPTGQDLAALASFVITAFWVTSRLWLNQSHGLADNEMDQAQAEWMLAHGARVVTDFVHPFVSYQMNVPDGVNLMANTSVLAVSIPISPVTLIFGPHVAFNVFLTTALIATAVSWYLLLSRSLVSSRAAAWIGALFCAFAPSMISHANGHPNIVSQFVVPLIIWRTLRLRESGRWLRNGSILGLLIIWQAFINLEILFMAAVGLAIFVTVMAILRPPYRNYVKPYAAGLTVAAAVALCALAYPLYVQFFGPQAYHGLPGYIRRYGADLASFVAFSRESIAGSEASAQHLAQNPTEENAFFGWPLTILVVAVVLWLWRNAVIVALAAVGASFAVMSLGPIISFNGQRTGIPSPWALVDELPVLDSVVPTRWALAIAPVVGLLLAYGCERAYNLARQHPAASGTIRFAAVTVLAMALIPNVPTTLPTKQLGPTPEFITSGSWRQYVDRNQSLVTLPLPAGSYPDPIRWAAHTGHELRIPRGYFLGPESDLEQPENRTGMFSAPWRPTARYFETIRKTGKAPVVTPQRRRELIDDLRYWRAGAVILVPGQKHSSAYRRAMIGLSGQQPRLVDGVWVWDVQPLIS